MAKSSAPTVEYFNILVGGVPTTELGAVMSALAKLGLTNVKPELVTEVHSFRQKQSHDVKAAEFIRAWCNDGHPTFKAKEVITHGDLHGRAPGAIYSGLRELTEEGFLKKLGEGNYSMKGVKALAAPKKPAKPEHGDSSKRYDIPHADLILKVANGGTFTVANMKKLFNKRRRPADSVGTAIKSLLTKGQIERVAEGEYKVLKKKNNGAAAAPTVEMSHG